MKYTVTADMLPYTQTMYKDVLSIPCLFRYCILLLLLSLFQERYTLRYVTP